MRNLGSSGRRDTPSQSPRDTIMRWERPRRATLGEWKFHGSDGVVGARIQKHCDALMLPVRHCEVPRESCRPYPAWEPKAWVGTEVCRELTLLRSGAVRMISTAMAHRSASTGESNPGMGRIELGLFITFIRGGSE